MSGNERGKRLPGYSAGPEVAEAVAVTVAAEELRATVAPVAGAPQICVGCQRSTSAPVLLARIDPGSGPVRGVYACEGCARHHPPDPDVPDPERKVP